MAQRGWPRNTGFCVRLPGNSEREGIGYAALKEHDVNELSLIHAAKVTVWVCAALLLYVYAIYPLLLALVAALFTHRRPAIGYTPTISFLVAAHNEEASMDRKLAETLSLDYPAEKLEILVLSDCSTDATDAIVRNCPDPRVRLLRMPRRNGKTHAQNAGAHAARGEILVFSDATTVYHPQALRYLAANYQDPAVGAVSGRYLYFDAGRASPTAAGTMLFWNYENYIKTLQSRIRTISGCCGCIYSVRKQLYEDLAPDMCSDLVLPLTVIQKGYRVVFEDRALAFEETTRSISEEFKMRVRVAAHGVNGLLSVPSLFKPWRYPWVSFQLVSHKVLRWFASIVMAVLLAGSVALAGEPGYRYLLPPQAAFYGLAVLGRIFPLHRYWKPLGVPSYFCTLNIAALLSFLEVLRGRKYAVWESARNQPG